MHNLIKLKDRMLLFITACIATILAGLFWYQLGEHAFTVLNALVVIALVLTNRALRSQLCKMRGDAL